LLWRKLRRRRVEIERVFRNATSPLAAFVRATRPHQWTKNLLLFVPLFLAHKVSDASLVAQAAAAFASFTLCAAGVYILNDLFDLEADRAHPSKRRRPFAAGDLSLSAGLIAAPSFTFAALILGGLQSSRFLLVLAGYLALTLAYSLYLKRIAFIDVIALAGLYTLRIFAGGEATGIEISFYTLAFSMFLFLSLALIKRFSELQRLNQESGAIVRGRGYVGVDALALQTHGIASGYIAVLVAALYLNSPEMRVLYTQPQWLWLICVILLYWMGRAWILAHRGQMNEDPVVFALRDRVSQALGLLTLMTLYLAS